MDSQPRPIASLSIGGSAIADEHVGKKVYWKGRVQKTQHRNVDVLVESSETDDYVAVLDFDAKPDSALPDNTEISFEGTLESKIMKGEDFIHRPDGSLYSKRTWRVFLKDAKVMKPLGAGKAEGQAEKSVSFEPGPVPASDKETSRPVPGAIYSLSVYDKATGRIEVLDRSIKEKLDNFCAALDMTKASDRERFVRKCVELLGTEKAQREILIYDSSGRPAFRWPSTGAQPRPQDRPASSPAPAPGPS